MIDLIVKKEFEKKIRAVFKHKEEIIQFVLKHPNRENLFLKVVTELKKAQLLKPELITAEVIAGIAGDFAVMFAKQALILKEKEILSQAALLAEKKRQDDLKEMMEGVQNADSATDIRGDATDI